mmetsp:Transcript_88433/g.286343  ORF Transcript_88433/g.286343 Transcript_88433/m.286343 type:complete len:292 (-) Transcript_88433:747-1622(-)
MKTSQCTTSKVQRGSSPSSIAEHCMVECAHGLDHLLDIAEEQAHLGSWLTLDRAHLVTEGEPPLQRCPDVPLPAPKLALGNSMGGLQLLQLSDLLQKQFPGLALIQQVAHHHLRRLELLHWAHPFMQEDLQEPLHLLHLLPEHRTQTLKAGEVLDGLEHLVLGCAITTGASYSVLHVADACAELERALDCLLIHPVRPRYPPQSRFDRRLIAQPLRSSHQGQDLVAMEYNILNRRVEQGSHGILHGAPNLQVGLVRCGRCSARVQENVKSGDHADGNHRVGDGEVRHAGVE